MQLGLLGKQNLAMNPKRRKRLSRPGNNFGHICFKVFLPANCVFMLKANLNPDFHKFFSFKLLFLQIWIFCENLGAPSNLSGCI